MIEDRRIEKNMIDFFTKYSVKEADLEDAKKTLFELFGVKDRAELKENKKYIQSYESIKQLRLELDTSTENLAGLEQVQSGLRLLQAVPQLPNNQ
jgi:hypothetical protein